MVEHIPIEMVVPQLLGTLVPLGVVVAEVRVVEVLVVVENTLHMVVHLAMMGIVAVPTSCGLLVVAPHTCPLHNHQKLKMVSMVLTCWLL